MRKIVLILLAVIATISVSGGQQPVQISDTVWKSEAEAYDYEEDVERKKPTKKKEPSGESLIDNDIEAPDLENIRIILFAVLIVAALVVIILVIVNSKTPMRKPEDRVVAKSLDEAEENLPDVALNKLYQDSVDAEDWKIALRIQFLMLLQELIYAGLIRWKKRKTNLQFASEIVDENIRIRFRSTVDVFDPVWYGTAVLKQDEFQHIHQQIESLKTMIENGES